MNKLKHIIFISSILFLNIFSSSCHYNGVKVCNYEWLTGKKYINEETKDIIEFTNNKTILFKWSETTEYPLLIGQEGRVYYDINGPCEFRVYLTSGAVGSFPYCANFKIYPDNNYIIATDYKEMKTIVFNLVNK